MWAELWNPLLTPVCTGAQQPLGVFRLYVLAGSPAPIVSRVYQFLGSFHMPLLSTYFSFLFLETISPSKLTCGINSCKLTWTGLP